VEEAQEGWVWVELGQFVKIMRGLSYKGSGLCSKDSGVPMHNLNSVYEGGDYKYEGIKYYSGDYKERHLVKHGDVIITNTEQGHDLLLIGFPAIVPSFFGIFGIFSQHIYKLRIKYEYISEPFLYYLLMSYAVREQITGATNGSTVNMLPKDGIEWAKFKLPPRSKIRKFTTIVEPYLDKKELIHSQIRTLEKFRDTLLPKLMSGKVRVKT
jgi:type I restriction enzyme S subunit